MTLAQAIQGCKENKRQAQAWLYKTYFPVLLPLCRRFSRDDDDVITFMNDGFMKVYKSIGQLQNVDRLVPWMKKIIYHAICDNLRKEKKNIRFLELENQDKEQEANALEQLYEEDILALLELIPNASAEVFVLYAIHGYNHREIGELKSISEGTSKWHLSEARKKLKHLLSQKLKFNINAV